MPILIIPDGLFLHDFSVVIKELQPRVGNYDCLVTSDGQEFPTGIQKLAFEVLANLT
jgi:hypothetical protein